MTGHTTFSADSNRKSRHLYQLINVLSGVVAMRDPYTASHQQNVARLARCIAQDLMLDDQQIEAVRVAATLHDIGKISIPLEILSKPGKLTAEEFALVTTHCRNGARLLETVDFPWPIGEIILHHHERLDGSGYPQGLRGNQIRLEARIIGVADTVDAVLSHRPYRPGKTLRDVTLILENGAGTIFDAEIVAACLRILDGRSPSHQFWRPDDQPMTAVSDRLTQQYSLTA